MFQTQGVNAHASDFTATQDAPASKATLWTGRILSGLLVLFFLFDGIGKILKPNEVIEGSAKLGFPESTLIPIGIALLVATILYVIPRTAFLGALLLTGYLGGATAANVRMEDAWFFFPVVLAILAWVGLALRDQRTRVLLRSLITGS